MNENGLSIKTDLIANYAGQGWTALMSFVFIPIYISYLGIETYGLMGIFAIVLACVSLLDSGIALTLNREMACFKAGKYTVDLALDLLWSVELLCVAIASIVIVFGFFSSDWLARHWVEHTTLAVVTVAHAIFLMIVVACLRLVEGVYRGALFGLQQHVRLNCLVAGFATFRAVGAVLVLAYVSPTIHVFFVWQVVSSLTTIVVLAWTTRKVIPKSPRKPHFRSAVLSDLRRFAGGILLTSALGLLLTQIDKIFLVRLMSLESFGSYTVAVTVSNVLYQLITPLTQSYYPRFTRLVATDQQDKLAILYHQSSQVLAVIAAPPALLLIFFGERLLALWTGNLVLSHQVAPLLSVLTAGTLLHGLVHIPYVLQLSNGWSDFAARVNIVAAALLVPAILWAVPRYGAQGAAYVWLVLNAGYLVFSVQLMHRRLLKFEKWTWYLSDNLLPIGVPCMIAFVIAYVLPSGTSRLIEMLSLLCSITLMFCSSLLVSSQLRRPVFDLYLKRRSG